MLVKKTSQTPHLLCFPSLHKMNPDNKSCCLLLLLFFGVNWKTHFRSSQQFQILILAFFPSDLLSQVKGNPLKNTVGIQFSTVSLCKSACFGPHCLLSYTQAYSLELGHPRVIMSFKSPSQLNSYYKSYSVVYLRCLNSDSSC